jgi:hypothetical protein
MSTYRIVRKFRNAHADEEIETGLSLEQAKLHCRNKETSSSTATSASAKAITEEMGPWFDCYEKEEG